MSSERINSAMPPGKTIHRHRWFLIFCMTMVLFDLVLWHFVKQMPYWGDKVHFVGTIQYFGHDFSWQKLVHYNEMSGPLPFLLYAGWGHLIGFELNDLRLFSLVISAVTYLSFLPRDQKMICPELIRRERVMNAFTTEISCADW